MNDNDLSALSTDKLLAIFPAVLNELRKRGIIRSSNNPVADYAEWLTSRALGLELVSRSTQGHDATDSDGNRYEVKSRRLSKYNPSRLSMIRGIEREHFNYLVGVLFNEDFSVRRACLVPHEVVKRLGRYNAHTNSTFFNLRDSVWDEIAVEDITTKLQAVEREHKGIGQISPSPKRP